MKSILTLVLSGFLGLNFLNSTAVVPDTETTTHLAQKSSAVHDNKVQIALLLDTSNSMDGLINQAKAQLWDIVNEFTYARCSHRKRPGLEIALYQYGNNELSSREGYIQQVLGFSDDLDEISQKLFSLTTNGGEEYCGQVIYTSIDQLDWNRNPDHLRMIFIAGNEPFTQGKLDYRDAISQAKEKDIVVNTIFCGDYHQGIQTEWQKGALLTGGEYMAIDHNREIVHVPTPYDEIIIRLNKRLNNTYISYGYEGSARMANQSAQDANAMELEEAVAVKRAVSKSSGYYKNSSWDLVDAADDEDFDVGQVERKHLPSELRSKSDKELATHIAAKKAERDQIQEEIRELDAKRQEFLAENQKEQQGELESAMLNAIKKQASKKNLNWTKE
ncbi:MAG: vWA domain-containing protein [Flavobacteriaceae bacterium]